MKCLNQNDQKEFSTVSPISDLISEGLVRIERNPEKPPDSNIENPLLNENAGRVDCFTIVEYISC